MKMFEKMKGKVGPSLNSLGMHPVPSYPCNSVANSEATGPFLCNSEGSY